MSERVKVTSKTPESKRDNSVSQTRKIDFSQSTTSPIDHILFLQRTIGNQVVQRLFKSGVIQAKLKIGQPGDIYEQEADRVAEQVMRMPEPSLQRQAEEEEEEQELIQTNPLAEQITSLVQRQVEEEEKEEEEEILQTKENPGQTPEVTPDLESRIQTLKGGGQSLPESVRALFEPSFGQDFSHVRIHNNPKAAEMAHMLNAKAFTLGHNIVFGSGEYAIGTVVGKNLLAHELSHVVQQFEQINSINQIQLKRKEVVYEGPKSVGKPLGEIVHWYAPWLWDVEFTPSSEVQKITIEKGSVESLDTGWKRDALGTATLTGAASIATAVIAKRISPNQLFALIAGGASAAARGYMGYHGQERAWGKILKYHKWWGRYRVNLLTGKLIGVKFYGIGPTELGVYKIYYQQRVVDADRNPIYTHWKHELMGFDPTSAESLPEHDFGVFTKEHIEKKARMEKEEHRKEYEECILSEFSWPGGTPSEEQVMKGLKICSEKTGYPSPSISKEKALEYIGELRGE